MIGFIILYVVTVAVFLWFWAMTQSQCNTNTDNIRTGFNIVKDDLKAHSEFDAAIEERVSKLEGRIKRLEMNPFNYPMFVNLEPQQKANDNTPAPWEEKPKAKTEEAKPELGYTIRVTDNGCTGIRPGTEDETNNDVG